MEIKGDEFIKNVQEKQEREELERKFNELEETKVEINENLSSKVREDKDSNEFDNIMLNEPPQEEDNKKKYLILGIVLVVLFLLTIIIIRLLTDDKSKNDPFTSNNTEKINKIEPENNIEKDFQKIIKERLQKEVEENNSEEKIEALENITKEEEKQIDTSNNIVDETIKNIEKKITQKKVEEVKKEKPKIKKVQKTEKNIKKLITSSSSKDIKGHFIQIGAFKKKPTNAYIKKIRNSNLKYAIYKTKVKGTLYHKVLIGPYSSRAIAKNSINSVKKKLNISSAYIIKF